MTPGRISLGREFSLAERTYGWLTRDAVEVDEVDGYDVSKHRVLLDEVLLVTLHRMRRFGVLTAWTIPASICLIVAFVAGKGSLSAAALAPFSFFALGFLVHVLLGTDYVTVFGRRSRARVAFNFRKDRARRVFDLIVREVNAAQGAHDAAAPPPPAVETPAA